MNTGLENNNETQDRVQVLEPVEVPHHGAEGNHQGSKTFTPGTVSNYPNIPLMKEAVRRYQGRLRRGTASTKTRGEINGSPHKPWRQKGTGRARAGSKKSPIWRGGGVVFGPRPRSYDYGMSRKQRRLATRHALLSKMVDGEALIIENLPADNPATAEFKKRFEAAGMNRSYLVCLPDAMSVEERRNVWLSCRNLDAVEVMPVSDLNALSLLRCNNLVMTAAAFEEIQTLESQHVAGEGQ
ncbi:MAG: 50S ribosomal protein L4 [Planctomycetia bacterium]|nr:50S ribosomal protein L4 [Planctomycetia bacterium]